MNSIPTSPQGYVQSADLKAFLGLRTKVQVERAAGRLEPLVTPNGTLYPLQQEPMRELLGARADSLLPHGALLTTDGAKGLVDTAQHPTVEKILTKVGPVPLVQGRWGESLYLRSNVQDALTKRGLLAGPVDATQGAADVTRVAKSRLPVSARATPANTSIADTGAATSVARAAHQRISPRSAAAFAVGAGAVMTGTALTNAMLSGADPAGRAVATGSIAVLAGAVVHLATKGAARPITAWGAGALAGSVVGGTSSLFSGLTAATQKDAS